MLGRHFRTVVRRQALSKSERLPVNGDVLREWIRAILLVGCGLWFSTCGVGCQSGGDAAKSREAAEAIFQAGGKLRVQGSDRTLAAAAELPAGDFSLSWIDLNQTKVSDEYLKFVEGLTSLEYLGLHSTSVTDAGLDHLASQARLAEIELSYTAITDAGLAKLAQLPALKKLFIYDTAITDAALADFQKKKPGCLVVR